MESHAAEDPKPDGAVFDTFFDSIGKKAENLTISDQNGTRDPATNGAGSTDLPDDNEPKVVDEIESLCMNCQENGITRLLLTRIPFFREIIIMSFFCPHCNFKNSEIQAAGEIQQKGSHYELRLRTSEDFARQVVKSDTCVVKFIELDIEVPAGRGQLTNVEGLLSMILEDLEVGQATRKEQMPEVYTKIEEIISKGKTMLAGESFPFRVSLDDPAGNSWIEPNQKDGVGKWSKTEYARTPEQNEALGLGVGNEQEALEPAAAGQPPAESFESDDIIPNEVYSFPATCPGCTRHCVTHMKMVEIPHFKQVVIMSTVCEECGYRSNEVKTGGEVPEKGKKIILQVNGPTDLARDILKSESCALECPELNLSVNPGTLGGRFTTVEGLLTQVRDDLHQQIFDVGDDTGSGGDSLPSEEKTTWKSFFDGLNEAIKGERKFTVVLKDPLASSYVQNLCSPADDPQIETEDYERTEEEEEDLGLLDMQTENYVDEVGEEKKRIADEQKVEDDKDVKRVEESNG
ncbi:nucleolar zinc-finger protein [Cadophora gregata f. sp. sojae]|nr:nucleolar zinc-finger protein [Cadophora gregata f. sp. sojae]